MRKYCAHWIVFVYIQIGMHTAAYQLTDLVLVVPHIKRRLYCAPSEIRSRVTIPFPRVSDFPKAITWK